MSQAPGRLLHQLVEQHVALTGCHLVLTDRGHTGREGEGVSGNYPQIPRRPPGPREAAEERPALPQQALCPPGASRWGRGGVGRRPFSPRVVVDVPPGLAPAQGCVVATVDAARVVAEGVQLVHGASCGAGAVEPSQRRRSPRPLTSRPSGPPSLTSSVTGKVPEAQPLQREVDTHRAFLDGASGGGKPIQICARVKEQGKGRRPVRGTEGSEAARPLPPRGAPSRAGQGAVAELPCPPLHTWGVRNKTGGRRQNLKVRIRSTRIRGNLCTVNFLVLRVFCRHRSHTWRNVRCQATVPLASMGFPNPDAARLSRLPVTCAASGLLPWPRRLGHPRDPNTNPDKHSPHESIMRPPVPTWSPPGPPP